jgi:CHAT domain-containing protein/Flp pilus assembly protein TadD
MVPLSAPASGYDHAPQPASSNESYYDRGFYYTDDPEKAIAYFSEAIKLDPMNIEYWNNRGIAYSDKGELDRGIENFNQALALNPNYVSALYNRGFAYHNKGELDKAIEDYNKTINLNPIHYYVWNNLGIAYYNKDEYDLAIKNYNKAIDIYPDLAAIWVNRGLSYWKKGFFYLAIKDFNKAIELDPNDPYAWDGLGDVYYSIGDLDQAIVNYSKAINIDSNYYIALNSRGEVQRDKGDLIRAASDFRQSLVAAERSNSIMNIFYQSWEFAGKFYDSYAFYNDRRASNKLAILYADAAREGIKRSVAKAEKARSSLGSRGVEIMNSLVYQYYAGVDLETRFGSFEEAYNYSEGLRSRGFLEQMGTEAALKLSGISLEEADKVRNLRNDINNYQKLLSSINPQRDAEKHAQAGVNLTKAETELEFLDASISAKIPRYGELRNPKPASLDLAKKWCGKSKAIIEYVLWDDTVEFNAPTRYLLQSSYKNRPSINSYCLVITMNGVIPVRLDSNFDYADAINNLRYDLITDKKSTALIEHDRNALYNALIKPVLYLIPFDIKELVIVPDGILGHLPFDILRENKNSPDLGETFRITLSPSVSVSVLAAKTGERKSLPIMAFGGAWYNKNKAAADRGQQVLNRLVDDKFSQSDLMSKNIKLWCDLPGTETEVKNLQTLVSSPRNIRVFLGSDVSEASIKKLSSQRELVKYPILHFACHGYFNKNDAERSGIVLSEVSGLINTVEDGYLTIPEIVLLDLNARMVLLSACETGLGTLKRGDGMVGMTRAFLVSGVENVGVSLWSIDDDATVEFMTRLYRKVLNEGKSFKEAYYLTKNEFRKGEKWNHPFYWAAFTMYE